MLTHWEVMNLNFSWSSENDDARVQEALCKMMSRGMKLTKSMKLDEPFIYINYASLDQDVYNGYGKENVRMLRKTKEKYDPQNVFGRLWPGYFKL